MTDSLWACPQCGRTSSQPPNVTSSFCLNYSGHKGNEAVEMERETDDADA